MTTRSGINNGELFLQGTYYGIYPVGKGACTLDPLTPLANQPGWIRVASGRPNYQSSLGCGMCVEIHGKGDGLGLDPIKGKIKAVVHDLCEGCSKDGKYFSMFCRI